MAMDITPLIPAERQVIHSYGNGGFRVAGGVFRGSILVMPAITRPWPVTVPEDADLENLAPILDAATAIELLLLGCGKRGAMVAPALRRELRARGVVVDVMDTGAACRTYNVLLAEDRGVAAALIAVD